jgi:glycosyltransferase involved in cell wall biosynthesis
MHIRTQLPNCLLARWQARSIANTMDRLVFITENEKECQARLAGGAKGDVIYNTTPDLETGPGAHTVVPSDGRLKIASLSNFAWRRGVDRLIDVAVELVNLECRNVLFVLAGDMNLQGTLPGRLGELGRQGATLAEYAEERGVSDMFLFLGHVSDPERVLESCDALAKLTRDDNPWGRDIIEALYMGRPVLSIGQWDGFVKTARTGFLYSSFLPKKVAEDIKQLAEDRSLCSRFGKAGQELVSTVCNPLERAKDLANVWRQVVERK